MCEEDALVKRLADIKVETLGATKTQFKAKVLLNTMGKR